MVRKRKRCNKSGIFLENDMRTWKMAATGLVLLTACVACAKKETSVSLIANPPRTVFLSTSDSYPGFEMPASCSDWTQFDALRLHVFNEGENMNLSYRVDDMTSKDFATRFSSDMPLRMVKGDNVLEISVAALRQGNLFARGLDVSQLKSLRFFTTGLKENTALQINDIRLIKRTAKGTKTVTDFAAKEAKTRIDAKDGTKITAAENAGKAAVKMEITGGQYPGIGMMGFDKNWLGYDVMTLKLWTDDGKTLPDGVSVKVKDRSRQMTFSTSLVENKGEIRIPVEMTGQLSQGQLFEMSVFFPPSPGKTVYAGNITLEAFDRVEYPTVHASGEMDVPALVKAQPLGMTLDFTALKALGQNSVFMGMVMATVEGGKMRIVRCNSSVKGNTMYEIPADAFAGCKIGSTIEVWGYLTEHGIWHFRRVTLPFDGKLPMTVKFDDPKLFNH